MSKNDPRPSVLQHRIERRTFLQAAGLGTIGLLAARAALGAAGEADPTAALAPAAQAGSGDPILDKALELDFDPERIFRFVADEIRYEPYAGGLRGALGTLQGRAGSSVDQALLLGALLSAAAIPIRFVSGSLDAEQADRLLAASTIELEAATAWANDVIGGQSDIASQAGALTSSERALAERLPGVIDRTVQLVEERSERATRDIVAALEAAGIRLPADETRLPEAEATRHTWVQAASGPEWRDLDPSMPDAVEGVAHVTPADPPSATLPDDLRHRVEIAVIAEMVAGGQLSEVRIIEHAAYADELAGQPINLSHEKPDGLTGLGLALGSFLEGVLQYQPILSVGDIALVGVESLSFASGGDVFGDEAARVGDGEATAEWLEVRIVTPERETTTRRAIFDRIGDERRAAGDVDVTELPTVELVDLDPELIDEYAPLRVVHFLDVATGATSSDRFTTTNEELEDAAAFALYPATYHILRDAISAAVALPRGAHTFLDAPNIVDFSVALRSGAAVPREERIALSVDLLSRSSAAVPLVGAPASPPGRLLAGVIEHEAERLAMGDGLHEEGFPVLDVEGVGAVFEAAQAQGVGTTVVLEPGDVERLSLRPDVSMRLRQGLEAGSLAVIPERPVQLNGEERIGWWLIDPMSGAAIDVFEDGRGTAMVGEGLLYNRIAYQVRKYVCLGLAIKQVMTFVKLVIGDYGGFLKGYLLGFPLHWLLGGHCH